MIEEKTFARYPAEGSVPLADLSCALLEHQQPTWSRLAEGHRSLAAVEQREIDCGAYLVKLQYNSRRIVSTGARVDAAAIQQRACFLCLENLPAAQQGILYRDEFLILCNPAPIFRAHFTISHRRHKPQALAGHLLSLLELTRDLSPRFSVFYNGPGCGASAPDHMHFQACPSESTPLETQVADPARRGEPREFAGTHVFSLRTLDRGFLVLEGRSLASVAELLERCVGVLHLQTASRDEPHLNILGQHREGMWRVILMPRRRHRPSVYALKEPDRILISPASVDLAGLVITPLAADFQRVNAGIIREIYREVSFDEEAITQWLSAL